MMIGPLDISREHMASKRWIWPSGLAELNSHHDLALRGLNQRHAPSVTFVWQAAGLAVMLANAQ